MAKSKTDQVKVAAQRLLELRPPTRASRDKSLSKKVRETASSLAHSGRLHSKPEPPKHRGTKVVAGAALAGGAAYAVRRRRHGAGANTTAATDQPVPAPTPPLAVAS